MQTFSSRDDALGAYDDMHISSSRAIALALLLLGRKCTSTDIQLYRIFQCEQAGATIIAADNVLVCWCASLRE